MQNAKVLIFSHMSHRDNPTDQMIAQQIQAGGHHVWLRPFLAHDRDAITTIKPDVLILPEIRNEYTQNIGDQMHQWGGRVIVRACEAGVDRLSAKEMDPEYKKAIFGYHNESCDLFLAWGPEMKESIVENSTVDRHKIVCCGALGFDPYFHPVSAQPEYEKPTFLFATGFPYADRNMQYCIPEARPGLDLHPRWVRKCQKGRGEWIKAIRAVNEEFGDEIQIIVKCHSGENPNNYRACLQDIPIIYNEREPSFLCVPYVDAVVHAGSTISYEAYLCKKPTVNYCNVSEHETLAKMSPNLETIPELLSWMHAVLTKKPSASTVNSYSVDVLESLYGPADGNTYIRAAQAVCQHIEGMGKPAVIPDQWPKETEPKFTDDPDVIFFSEMWRCDACAKNYFVIREREMVKCPYCGIANVKRIIPNGPKT